MVGHNAYRVWQRIKQMIILNKSFEYDELIKAPIYPIQAFYNEGGLIQERFKMLENHYSIDEIVQMFSSILFVNPWSSIDDVLIKKNQDVNFIFYKEPINFLHYFKITIGNIFLNNLYENLDKIFNVKTIKNLYPNYLTPSQLYVLSKIWPNIIEKESVYGNIVNNWKTVIKFNLDNLVNESEKIIVKQKNFIDKKFLVL